MKLFCTFVCGLVINFIWSQFQDDFTNSSAYPVPWEGQSSQFSIQNEKLQLNSSGAGNSRIYLPPPFFYYPEIEVRTQVRLNFSPSSNNNLRLFLYSDTMDLSLATNALYLQLGESGSNDAVSLRGIFNGTDMELARGIDGRIASSFEISLKITHNNSQVNIDLWNDTLNQYESEIQYLDTSGFFFNSLHFDCHYTASNSTNFYLDDVYVGPIQYDTIPPSLQSVEVLNSHQLKLMFSEPIDTSVLSNSQFQIDNPSFQNATNWNYSNGLLQLTFPNSFSNNQNSILVLDSISDLAGNKSYIDTSFHLLYADSIAYFDLELTEIFADPSPSFGLPECEYIEIQNRSSKILDISDLFIADFSDTNAIDTQLFVFPNEFILLTEFGCLDSFNLQKIAEVNLPSLNNSEDRILILDQYYLVIDSVTYSDSWHSNDKDDGGFSLEKAELGLNCNLENWFSSIDSLGGTPGMVNSVFESPLNYAIRLKKWEFINSNQIQLRFNKNIQNSWQNASVSSNVYLIGVYPESDEILNLDSGPPILYGDNIWIEIQNLQDCFGNKLDTLIDFTIPFPPDSGEVIINEILFDPIDGGTDFVELYNHSEKDINLKNCGLANWNDSLISIKTITEDQFILKPQQYCLISKDSIWVKNVFKTDNERIFLDISSLPSMPNDEGSILLINADEEILDRLDYDENMHYPLLTDYENKSLERISFSAPTNESSNWNTASGNVNYGTPGYQNSQLIPDHPNLEFDLEPEYFTPNNDGNKDNLKISIVDQPAGIYNLEIFNLEGSSVQKLISSEYISGTKTVFWDGKNEDQFLCNSGPYILVLSFIRDDGQKGSKRKTAYLKL